MMNFSGPEILLVLVIVLIIFGAGKLPQVFSSLGKGVREFRDAAEGDPTTTTTTSTASTPTAPPPAPPAAPVTPVASSTTTTEEVKRQG
ncbi:MAG: twin-arginine translocase TatA/TatE family subunit [Chloroflexota bacterium]|nr:twin-arginine translocase TatA/TatE family subunit [Chloroflexota bacterium]MDQ5865591.1 twin-arginine translocase TatA/TatE family subunit [Chloroflexota bacterium]